MISTRKEGEKELAGLVYRVLGPDGRYRWIARSIYGHVAHGRTPDSAVQNLRAGLKALAQASGRTVNDWQRTQGADSSRFLRASELVQA